MRSPKRFFFLTTLIVVLVVGYQWVSNEGFDLGDIVPRSVPDYDSAADRLGGLVDQVTWQEKRISNVTTITETADSLDATLPSISTFPLVVDPGSGGVTAEIFVSTEKSGSGTDGWMTEAAQSFNQANNRLPDGRQAKVRIRKIASGTGYQFIGSGKYRPDAYSPSNHLWVQMARARGVTMTGVRETTVRNIAGIVMKDDVAEQLEQEGGAVTVPRVVDAVVQGKIAAGYTNPFASSTGLNFLVTVLATFAEGEEPRMLSPEVVSAFEGFQRGVPFVALTTLQMRESVRRDGSLDAFVMEYQTYAKTRELESGYVFLPFGLLHDNPLYAVGDPGQDKMAVLELFARHLEGPRYRDLASEYGFNPSLTHQPAFGLPSGETLIEAQRLWKEKKDAGRPIAAVFLSDTSGSMSGSRLSQLKKALLQGSSFIAPSNSIGLVEFSNEVSVLLPIKPFALIHKSAFHAAVKSMEANGGTAMYDGIAVALKMLVEEKARRPEVKPLLFVLTDGQTNEGLSFGAIETVIEGLRIPVYTIGFEADIQELTRLSGLVEAASLKSDEEDIRYKIGALLNSQM